VDLSSDLTLLGTYISKKWRMDIFIRHKCGNRKNNVEQRCTKWKLLIFVWSNKMKNQKTKSKTPYLRELIRGNPLTYLILNKIILQCFSLIMTTQICCGNRKWGSSIVNRFWRKTQPFSKIYLMSGWKFTKLLSQICKIFWTLSCFYGVVNQRE